MKIKGRKIAVSGLTRVALIPMRKETDFVILHKKGENYKKFNFKYPFWHNFQYEENVYRDISCFSINDEFNESDILSNYTCYMVKDYEVFVKPNVTIVYLDGKEKIEYFDTYQDAKIRYDELSTKCNLMEVVND